MPKNWIVGFNARPCDLCANVEDPNKRRFTPTQWGLLCPECFNGWRRYQDNVGRPRELCDED